MDSQAPVFARALKTYPDPVGHTNPLRVKSPTLKAKLRKTRYSEWIIHIWFIVQ